MKKKIIILCIFLFSVTVITYAQVTKRYTYNGNYIGAAGAKYLGTTATVNAEHEFQKIREEILSHPAYNDYGICKKLSNVEDILIKSALHEYDLIEKEVYKVTVITGGPILDLIVTIDKIRKDSINYSFLGNYNTVNIFKL